MVEYIFDVASSQVWTDAGLTPSITAALITTDGAPSGSGACIKFSSSTGGLTSVIERCRGPLLTWEDMGVPAGKIVTECYCPSFYYKKASTTGVSVTQVDHRIVNSSNVNALSSSMCTTGLGTTTSGWVQSTVASERPLVLAANQASNTQVRLEFGLKLTTTTGVVADIRFDLLKIYISYAPPGRGNTLTFV
jgi:hypothetical protein